MNIIKEGSSYTNLLKLMKTQGHNKDTNVIIGAITSVSPITISLGKFSIEEGDFFKTNTFHLSRPEKGDFVMVLIDGNDFYVIDKVV